MADDELTLVIPEEYETPEEKLEYIEAVKEGLRLCHNELAQTNPIKWVTWVENVFKPRSLAVSKARNDLIDNNKGVLAPTAKDESGLDTMKDDAPVVKIKQSVRSKGRDHSVVDTTFKSLMPE